MPNAAIAELLKPPASSAPLAVETSTAKTLHDAAVFFFLGATVSTFSTTSSVGTNSLWQLPSLVCIQQIPQGLVCTKALLKISKLFFGDKDSVFVQHPSVSAWTFVSTFSHDVTSFSSEQEALKPHT
jgi:hypothetical protein